MQDAEWLNRKERVFYLVPGGQKPTIQKHKITHGVAKLSKAKQGSYQGIKTGTKNIARQVTRRIKKSRLGGA